MSTKNVQLVRDFFAALGRGDQQKLLALCAETIEWTIPGEWALAGTHRGHGGLQAVLEKAPGTTEISQTEHQEFLAQGDRVVVFGVASGYVKPTGKPFRDDFVFSFTLQNGKIAKIREYIDTLALALASETAVRP